MSDETPDPIEILASMRRTLRVLVVTTVVLFLSLAGGGVWVATNAAENHDALCALRSDLEVRVATSVKFLVEHPEGVAGIPAATIQEGIVNQRRTIDALSGLSC